MSNLSALWMDAPVIESLEARTMLSRAAAFTLVQTNLVSDGTLPAVTVDANLHNAWGLAINPVGNNLFVASTSAGQVETYTPDGAVATSPISVPSPLQGTSAVSALAANPRSSDFVLTFEKVINGQTVRSAAAAEFLFATNDGSIGGYNGKLTDQAITVFNNVAAPAVYTGLTVARIGSQSYLYAADFHNGRIDVFDTNFHQVFSADRFLDSRLDPALGYSPFNIQSIGNRLYVTYAKRNPVTGGPVFGAGNGIINSFDVRGRVARRFATEGALDAPWGVTQAPAGFGQFGKQILVGNFGNGKINAFRSNGKPIGTLQNANQQDIVINGLWSLQFQSGKKANQQTLFFSAGPDVNPNDNQVDGLVGKITAVRA